MGRSPERYMQLILALSVACYSAASLALVLISAPPVHAQSGGGYELIWSTIDGGGGGSSGGGYALSGTAGQHDVGIQTAGAYSLRSGFWFGYVPAPGDCNNDAIVNAGDISALILEIFDADGDVPDQAPGSTFVGDPDGCNANRDGRINAGDISCVILLIFNGPGSC